MTKARDIADIDQELSTTDSPTFANVTAGDMFITGPSPLLTLTDNSIANEYTTIENNSGNAFYTSRNGAANGQHIWKQFDGTTTTEIMRVHATGNVGIGTASPGVKLDVVGDAEINGNLDVLGTTPSIDIIETDVTDADTTRMVLSANIFRLQTVNNGTYIAEDYTIAKDASGATKHRFNIAAVEKMHVDSDGVAVNGNMVVGTTAPWTTASSWRSIKLTDRHAIQATPSASSVAISSNAAMGSAGWEYTVTGVVAGSYTLSGNTHIWNSAASGTDGGAVTFSERMRIDASGNVLMGKTSADNTTEGFTFYGAADGVSIVKASGEPLILNRLTNDGNILTLRKDGTTVGSIGSRTAGSAITSYIEFYAGSSNSVGLGGTSTPAVLPILNGTATDNTVDLGVASIRFDDIYATNGTIQTSDRNEKEAIASLTPTEMLVAARLSSSFKNFKWKDAVAEKGAAARMHSGIIAQDVQDAFTAEGLDAGDYAMFISNTWWETQTDVPAVEAVAGIEGVQAVEAVEYAEAVEATYDVEGIELTPYVPEVQAVDAVIGVEAVEAVEAADAYTRTDTYDTLEEAPEGATERTRLGVRYPELLAFVAAYSDQRFLTIETRLTALEA